MKTAILMILTLMLAPPLLSEEGGQKASPVQDVVDAAKKAKKKRNQPATKVLTNKDVKNSKGKLIELPASSSPAEEKQREGASPLEQHDTDYRARLALEERLAAATAAITALEKELESIELRYYEENDPDRRDKVIRKQFDQTKQKIETARKELESQP